MFTENMLQGFTAESTTPEPSGNSTEQKIDDAANSLFDEYWQMTLMDDPELATSLGDHRFDNRLTGYSLKCYEKRKVKQKKKNL